MAGPRAAAAAAGRRADDGQAAARGRGETQALVRRVLAALDAGCQGDAEKLCRAAFDAMVALEPDNPEAHASLAVALRRLGRLDEAVAALRQAIRLAPGRAAAHADLGHALAGLGRLAEAAAAFHEAARRDPGDADAHANLGAALLGLNRFGEAAAACAEAVRLAPGHANAHANLGFALAGLDRLDEAVAACAEAIRLAPGHANAHANLGFALIGLARFEEAIVTLEAAIALDPGHAQAHRSLALVLLLLARFERGWDEYEYRRQHLPPEGQQLVARSGGGEISARPRWRGEALAGRIVLLHAEQGLGDTVQFVRYVSDMAKRRGRVLLLVPPAAARLLHGLPGVHRLLTFGEGLPDFDLHCPLLSLPRVLGTVTLDAIPARVPYLWAEPEAIGRWRERLGGLRGLRVGLAWAGNPDHGNDRNRSVAFPHLAPLWQVPGVDWVSLQIGPRAADLGDALAGVVIHDLAPDLHDLAETAAAMYHLDLVLTVDNRRRPPRRSVGAAGLGHAALRAGLALDARTRGQPLVSDLAPVPPGAGRRLGGRPRADRRRARGAAVAGRGRRRTQPALGQVEPFRDTGQGPSPRWFSVGSLVWTAMMFSPASKRR